MVRTNGPRNSRTQNRRSRTHHSKHSWTSIGGQIYHIKRSYLHFSQYRGVDGSQLNEYWHWQLSIIRSYPRNFLILVKKNNFLTIIKIPITIIYTSFTPINLVHLALFSIPFEMNSFLNFPYILKKKLYYPNTKQTYYLRQSDEFPIELYLIPCPTIHELTSWNMLNKFLQCILHCNHFMPLIDQVILEHVWHGQLDLLDKI